MSRNSLPKQQVRSGKIPLIVLQDTCTSQVNTDAYIKLSWSGCLNVNTVYFLVKQVLHVPYLKHFPLEMLQYEFYQHVILSFLHWMERGR